MNKYIINFLIIISLFTLTGCSYHTSHISNHSYSTIQNHQHFIIHKYNNEFYIQPIQNNFNQFKSQQEHSLLSQDNQNLRNIKNTSQRFNAHKKIKHHFTIIKNIIDNNNNNVYQKLIVYHNHKGLLTTHYPSLSNKNTLQHLTKQRWISNLSIHSNHNILYLNHFRLSPIHSSYAKYKLQQNHINLAKEHY